MTDGPEIIQMHVLDCQVCVPAWWTDEEVVKFTETEYPCGTTGGWHVRKEGSERLQGMPERNPCLSRVGFVHVVLDA